MPEKFAGKLLAGGSVEPGGKLAGAGRTPGESWEAACGEVEVSGKPVRIPEELNQEAACWVPLTLQQVRSTGVSYASQVPRGLERGDALWNYEEKPPSSQRPSSTLS